MEVEMAHPNRSQLVEEYARGFQALQRALEAFPPGMWSFKPSPAAWSIHEILIHLGDAEVQSHVRFRTVIAEPSSDLPCFDEYTWSTALAYSGQDASRSLDIIRIMREANAALLSTLPDQAWERVGIHATRGPETLETLVCGYTSHLHQHIAQMRRCHEAWQRAVTA